MNILFTGASSFTGFWFVKELSKAGHKVYTTFTGKSLDNYIGLRKLRISNLLGYCEPLWNCNFGEDNFINFINENSIDILCHHAAYVQNYKSQDFEFINAVKNNTRNISKVFQSLKQNNCNAVILTGTIFEQLEGCGEQPLKAFSPYGLSKGLTSEVFKYFTSFFEHKMGKFVIPNPFGPFEDPRFTTFLINQWKDNKIPEVKTPKYVRDNIHISLLAKMYKYFVEKVYYENNTYQKLNPSGYIETQSDFAKRFSSEIGFRLKIKTPLKFANQKEFIEPIMRVNCDSASNLIKEWSEEKAWDELAKYYEEYILS